MNLTKMQKPLLTLIIFSMFSIKMMTVWISSQSRQNNYREYGLTIGLNLTLSTSILTEI